MLKAPIYLCLALNGLNDALENYECGIVGFNPNKEKIYPIDEMKKLVNILKEDKKNNTEQLLKLKKKYYL